MREQLTAASKSELHADTNADTVPVLLGHSAAVSSDGASHAGPRVERAEARQQRDASTAPVILTVNASEITDAKAFIAFLQRAGFARDFAKRVTNRDAFKSAAAPSADDTEIANAIITTLAGLAETIDRG